jgi:hypothetical protein
MQQDYEPYTKCLTCGQELGDDTVCTNCGRGKSNAHNWWLLAAGFLTVPYLLMRHLSGGCVLMQ